MKTNNLVPAAVINANNIMALSVTRSLGRQGIPVNAFFGRHVDRSPYNMIVSHSRYINRPYYFEENNYAESMISLLIDSGKKADNKAVLFPVSDQDMIIISAHRRLLSDYYHLLMPSHKILDTLLSKEKFYKFASANNLPIPKTYFATDKAALDRISREVDYPCIMKPSWRDGRWLAMFRNTKVIISRNPEELRNNYHHLSQLVQKIIVQEIVQGDESNILCSFTYLDKASEMLGMTLCRKIRQFPQYFGNAALAETVNDPAGEELTKNICKQLKLTGYVSIEFKRDHKNNDLKIIEITPARINRHAGLSDSAGFNIPVTWYNYLTAGCVKANDRQQLHVKWLSEVNDLRTIHNYLTSGNYSFLELLRSYKNIKRFEVLSRDDLKPLLYLIPSTLAHLLSRYRVNNKREQ